MNQGPLVTICLTAYNSQATIKKTLESIINQSYSNIEILVSDNGSTDATLGIVASFKNSKITIRHNIKKIVSDKPYIGSYDNYNGCLQSGMIHGEFVAFYHADDIYQKDMVKKEVEFLINHQNAGAVFTMGNMIDQNDIIVGRHRLPKTLKKNEVYQFQEIFKNILFYGNTFLLTPTLMARKKTLKNAGLFSSEEDFGTSADLEMWLRIAKKYPLGILKETLINRRIGGGGKSYNSLRTKEADYFKVMDYYLTSEPHIEKKYLRQYTYQKDFDNTLRTMNFLMRGQTQEAKKLINTSFWVENTVAFFENMNLLRTKVLVLKITLFVGINLGFGKYLGKILYRVS